MKNLLVVLVTSLFFLNFQIYSQSLDPTFSDDGIQTTSIGSGNDFGFESAIQTDGKIVVSATKFDGINYDIVALRYNVNGTLDTSFGNNGVFTISTETIAIDITAIKLQNNGKIVIASTNRDPNSSIRFYIIQLNSDGTLDTTFNNTGIKTITIESYYQPSVGLLIQNDGKILISGSTYNGGLLSQIFINRYNTNGSIDATFANNGVFTTTSSDTDTVFQSIALCTDGKIIVVGKTGSIFDSFFDGTSIFRLNNDGIFDTTFNGNGNVNLDYVIGTSITLQTDEKILLSGSINGFAVLRLNSDGTIDFTFSNDGIQSTNINSSLDYCSAIVVQNDGKIILSGTYLVDEYNIAFVRYNNEGSLDTTFNGTGILTSSINIGNDIVSSVNLQTDGKIVVVGSTFTGNNFDVFALRYTNTNLKNEVFTGKKLLKIFPNPTENNFSISGIKNIEYIEIYDEYGKLLKKIKNNFNLSVESSGVYFLKIYTNSQIYNSKIIRQ